MTLPAEDEAPSPALTATQAALAAEHAAVYGYGVLGARVPEKRRTEASAAYDGHRARRDALQRTVRDLGGAPVAADAAYALPFAVADTASALRLAAVLEDRIAGACSDLVRATEGPAARRRGGRTARGRRAGGPLAGRQRSLSGARRAGLGRRSGRDDGPGGGRGSGHPQS